VSPAHYRHPQGRCDVTETPRFDNPDCKCRTYTGNLGPCASFEQGANGRCVYCDHEQSCHCQHEFTGQQAGGPPDMAESTEWVKYCRHCGYEPTE